ncbi:MAG: HD domain-containing protein, partial [Spirochaetia bacterium]|nr:HD domain-containing protein [Spirochaetia bacterium]
QITPAMSETYREEAAEAIAARIEKIHFEPFPVIKNGVKKNIHQFKEIFEKNVANNSIQLNSKNNRAISHNIAEFLLALFENTLHASDYIEMVNGIRSEDNYVTFSHPSAMAFYTVGIAKKLKMLREDFLLTKNQGRWIPIKTKKNSKSGGSVAFSDQLLKYLDQQKSNTEIKFRGSDREAILETTHDLMYEYAAIDWNRKYPSMQIDYSPANMGYLAMAALNADIGKMTISNSILNKPDGLGEEERKIIETHPIQGIHLLKGVEFDIPRVYAYILGHHRLSQDIGYPSFGNQPFPESKIIAMTDIYDAMRSPKHYGDVRTQDEAFQSLEDLFKRDCFDLPLYIAARHTFHEFNHDFMKRRNRQSIAA